ncbi:MAG: hypothetical protein IJH60_02920 [Eubacterium sp.]|nr:hypothetical protein [Eubacterium sp.]
MKNRILVLILCVALLLAGCSGKKDSKEKAGEGQTAETTTEASQEMDTQPQQTEEDKAEGTAKTSDNDTGVYLTSDKVVDVSMGCNENGNQKELCKIKMPSDYFVTSNYMEDTGSQSLMLETDGRVLSDVIESGDLEKAPYFPCFVTIHAEGATESFVFEIKKSGDISVESEKDFEPNGVDLGKGSDHEAYIYSVSDDNVDLVMVYEINDDWSLMILNDGDLKDKMPLDQIGQKFYNLITPL